MAASNAEESGAQDAVSEPRVRDHCLRGQGADVENYLLAHYQ